MQATKQQNNIIVCESDYKHLQALIDANDTAAADALDAELSRAEVVKDSQFPDDAVAMGSTVMFTDLDSGEETTVTLVYPKEAKVDEMRISVLSPVGSALIGLRAGGTIDWPLPGGKVRRLQVVKVTRKSE